MITFQYLTCEHYDVEDKHLENYLLQSGAIWVNGTTAKSIMAQVMHYNKDKRLVFCIQKKNFGYEEMAPDTYTLNDFIKKFTFMGIKE